MYVVDAVAPWERWCGGGVERGFAYWCFRAAAWSGSARLLGQLAVALAIAFLIATLARGLTSPLGPVRVATFAGLFAAVAAKAIIVERNASLTLSEGGSASSAAWIGTVVGIVLAIVGGVLLLAEFAARPQRLSIVSAVAAVVLVTALAIAYAGTGLAWWGGPLAEPQSLGGGNGMSMIVQPGTPRLFYQLIWIRNAGDMTATLDGLDIVDGTGSLHVLGAYVIERAPCRTGHVPLPTLDASFCAYPLVGARLSPMDEHDSVLLGIEFQMDSPGVYRAGWFRVRYHVGALPFEIFRTDEFGVCAPEPGEHRCPGSGL